MSDKDKVSAEEREAVSLEDDAVSAHGMKAEEREAVSLEDDAVSAHGMKAEAASAERSAPEDKDDDEDVELHQFKSERTTAE